MSDLLATLESAKALTAATKQARVEAAKAAVTEAIQRAVAGAGTDVVVTLDRDIGPDVLAWVEESAAVRVGLTVAQSFAEIHINLALPHRPTQTLRPDVADGIADAKVG